MRRATVSLLLLTLAAAPATWVAAAEPKTDAEKTLYAMGVVLAQRVQGVGLTAAELDFVVAGMTDSVLKRPLKASLEEWGPKIQAMAEARLTKVAAAAKARGAAFVDKAAAAEGAVRTDSGLVYAETRAGTGAQPKASDKVRVHYTGRLMDGSTFDSSVDRGEPIDFPLSGVIPCWTEGLQLMKIGGQATLTCPSDIAYGDQGRPPKIPAGATLVFDVELLDIVTK